jgi:prepilin-type processing-associated H-X9-DG protein
MPMEEHSHQTAVNRVKANSRPLANRSGITLLDLVVLLALGVFALLVFVPFLYQATLKIVRFGCDTNLRTIGMAIRSYESTQRSLPVGSAYQSQPASPWGTSWWVEIVPHLSGSGAERWQPTTSSGSFATEKANPNYPRLDGLRFGVMNCPSSPQPVFNDPRRHISAANRQSLGHSPTGIAVPTYVAIAGSAPDMRVRGNAAPTGPAFGRTTRDGPRGVLSASGAFPPNRSLRLASLRDGEQHTLLIGEQSDWFYDRQYEPAVLYEARSSWPDGAYIGLEAPYSDLSPTADGANGSGDARAYNITTLRHPINHRRRGNGVLAEAVTPVPSRPAEPPRIAPELPGPGHNQGLFSNHAGGANVLFADGHVRFLTDSTDLRVLLYLATRDDDQFVDIGPK